MKPSCCIWANQMRASFEVSYPISSIKRVDVFVLLGSYCSFGLIIGDYVMIDFLVGTQNWFFIMLLLAFLG